MAESGLRNQRSSGSAAAITALTLLNGTFEKIAGFCRRDAFKLMLGPSAPLLPVMFKYGPDAVGGTVAEAIPALTRCLSRALTSGALPAKGRPS